MAYRRTEQVVRRLAARRAAILRAARDEATASGLAGVQIAPVARRARIAAGTVYRYFPSKAALVAELITEVSRQEVAAIRHAANAAPGPLSALAAAIATTAHHIIANGRLAWALTAEPVEAEVTAARSEGRSAVAAELAARVAAAIRGGHLPQQDTALASAAIIGALQEGLGGVLAPTVLTDPAQARDIVQALTLHTLRAVGILDARARGLVVQSTAAPGSPARS